MDETNMQTGSRSGGLWGVLTALLVLLMILSAVLIAERGYKLFTSFGGVQAEKTLPVSAEGKVKAVPDTAIVTLGVISQGANAKDTQTVAAEKINKINAFVKSLGIPSEDITTTQSSINPRYNWENGLNNIIGYESNQTVTVKVRGINESTEVVEKLTAGAIDNGANQVYGSTFTIDDPDALRQEARLQAIEKAKVKAQELASAAGIKIGRVISVSESGSYYPVPMYADKGIAVSEGYGGGGAVPASVEPGQQEIVQQMTVVFEIK